MFLLLFLGIAVLMLFGMVLLVGPPYLPTLRKQLNSALDMLDLQPGQTLVELGSGDGRVLLAAAKRGLQVIGVELNPVLVLVSYLITWKYRKQVRIVWASYWGPDWPKADAIFTFMLPKYMSKLDKRIDRWRKGPVKLASFAFSVPGREPTQERDGVFLYEYK